VMLACSKESRHGERKSGEAFTPTVDPTTTAGSITPKPPVTITPKPPDDDIPASIDGDTLPSALVARVMRANAKTPRRCYEDGLAKNPSLAGRVVVRFVIQTNGTVSKAEIDPSSTLANAAVTTCILAGVKAIRFPTRTSGDAVTVSFPLVYSAR